MRVCTLASSSKGNCCVVWNDDSALLIDCGIAYTHAVQRLHLLGVSMDQIKGVLITHEHSDHICGLKNLLKKYPHIMCYVYQPAYAVMLSKLEGIEENRILPFSQAGFVVGGYRVESFPVYHDAVACVGYSIYEGDQKMSILTDSGVMTKDLLMRLYGSKLVILESNYDYDMLWANPEYPTILKQRIDGEFGHLDNRWASHAVADLVDHGVRQIVLAHLSEKNNTPEIARKESEYACEQKGYVAGVHYLLDVAPAHHPSNIYHLRAK